MAKKKKFKKRKKQIVNLSTSAIALLIIVVVGIILYFTGAFDGMLNGSLGGNRVPTAVKGQMQMHFLDVGQGDCILLLSEGKSMLVDTGDKDDTYNKKIVDYLKEYGISTINYLVLTHPDADHIGGAPDVINNFTVEKCIMPNYTKTTKIFEDTLDALDKNNVEVIDANAAVSNDNGFTVGEAKCEILAPLSDSYADVNDASVVIYVSFGEKGILLTGDAESESEEDMVSRYSSKILKADVLKSGHHGSTTSSGDEFLDLVAPKYAVISCGEGNQYNHPHKETLDRYEDRNIEIYRTDLHGTIIMITDGKNIEFLLEK